MENEQKDYSEIEQFLKERGKTGFLGDILHLKHYSCEMALSMLESKQIFISFLLGLQNITLKDYSLLTAHADKAKEFHRLFIEWLLKNKIFSDKELEYCSKLRTPAFFTMFRLVERTPGFESTFFQFLIAYSVTK
jgi:hypothetical protein